MTVDQAFEHFESSARAHGLVVPAGDGEPGTVGDRLVELEQDGAGIRLVWDEGAGLLSLDLSHGPPDEPPAGWLDLYRAVCVSGHLQPDQGDFDFEEAVDHGLSLFAPQV